MDICVLLVSYDSGHYRARMGRGPERLFELGLKPVLSRFGHTVVREDITLSAAYPAEIAAAFQLCGKVAERVEWFRGRGCFPIVLSGNCNVAVGAIAGCGCKDTAMVWFDAHGEGNTPDSTASGFLDGMGISILTGQSWRKLARAIPRFTPISGKRVLLIGSRDVEPEESTNLDRAGVVRLSGEHDLPTHLEALSPAVDGVYLHFDLDVLDPSVARANSLAVDGGLLVEDLIAAISAVQAHTRIKALGIASYDPERDPEGKATDAAAAITEALLLGIS